MYKGQKIKKCPKCGTEAGLMRCPKCHPPVNIKLKDALKLNEEWRVWRAKD